MTTSPDKRIASMIHVGGLTDLQAVMDAFEKSSTAAACRETCANGMNIEATDGYLHNPANGGLLARCSNQATAEHLSDCANAVPKLVKLLDEAAAEIRRQQSSLTAAEKQVDEAVRLLRAVGDGGIFTLMAESPDDADVWYDQRDQFLEGK